MVFCCKAMVTQTRRRHHVKPPLRASIRRPRKAKTPFTGGRQGAIAALRFSRLKPHRTTTCPSCEGLRLAGTTTSPFAWYQIKTNHTWLEYFVFVSGSQQWHCITVTILVWFILLSTTNHPPPLLTTKHVDHYQWLPMTTNLWIALTNLRRWTARRFLCCCLLQRRLALNAWCASLGRHATAADELKPWLSLGSLYGDAHLRIASWWGWCKDGYDGRDKDGDDMWWL